MNRREFKNISHDIAGATIVEFSLALLAFVMLFIVLVDFARYVEAKGVLNSGALEAVALATTVPGLDLIDRTDPLYTGAYKKVQDKALVLPESTLFTGGSSPMTIKQIITTDPSNPPPDTRCSNGQNVCLIVPPRIDLEKEPIKIVMKGTYDPMFPGAPNLPITVIATAFREPRTTSSMPILSDCKGNRYGSPNYFQDCFSSCTGPGKAWDPSTRSCKCVWMYGFMQASNGNCECNPWANFLQDPSDPTNCICAQTYSCSAPKVFNTQTCNCACDPQAEPSCQQSGGTFNSGNCGCSCVGLGRITNANGQCVCDASNGWQLAGNSTCIPNTGGSAE